MLVYSAIMLMNTTSDFNNVLVNVANNIKGILQDLALSFVSV